MMMVLQNTASGAFKQINDIKPNSWLHLVSPDQAEMNKVADQLSIPHEFLTDPLDMDEQPRIQTFGDKTLIVIHVPYNQPEMTDLSENVKYRTIPFGIILTKDYSITVCRESVPFAEKLFKEHAYGLSTENQIRSTIMLISEASKAFVSIIAEMELEITKAEDELAKSYRNRELYTLLYLNDSLLYMTTSLKQMQFLMQKLKSGHLPLAHEEGELLEDAIIELEQAYEMAGIDQSNLNNIMDAYGNIIQNNVNRVLKFLAAVTIILSVPTLIASIYGMNVPLPYQEEPHAFSILIVAMAVLSALFTYVFYKKRFF